MVFYSKISMFNKHYLSCLTHLSNGSEKNCSSSQSLNQALVRKKVLNKALLTCFLQTLYLIELNSLLSRRCVWTPIPQATEQSDQSDHRSALSPAWSAAVWGVGWETSWGASWCSLRAAYLFTLLASVELLAGRLPVGWLLCTLFTSLVFCLLSACTTASMLLSTLATGMP